MMTLQSSASRGETRHNSVLACSGSDSSREENDAESIARTLQKIRPPQDPEPLKEQMSSDHEKDVTMTPAEKADVDAPPPSKKASGDSSPPFKTAKRQVASSISAKKALDDSESAIASLFPVAPPPAKRSKPASLASASTSSSGGEQSKRPGGALAGASAAPEDASTDCEARAATSSSTRHLAAAAYEGSRRAAELYAAQHPANFFSRVHPAFFAAKRLRMAMAASKSSGTSDNLFGGHISDAQANAAARVFHGSTVFPRVGPINEQGDGFKNKPLFVRCPSDESTHSDITACASLTGSPHAADPDKDDISFFFDQDSEKLKSQSNARERRRREGLNSHFKMLEDELELALRSRVEKVTVLSGAIQLIKLLREENSELQDENDVAKKHVGILADCVQKAFIFGLPQLSDRGPPRVERLANPVTATTDHSASRPADRDEDKQTRVKTEPADERHLSAAFEKYNNVGPDASAAAFGVPGHGHGGLAGAACTSLPHIDFASEQQSLDRLSRSYLSGNMPSAEDAESSHMANMGLRVHTQHMNSVPPSSSAGARPPRVSIAEAERFAAADDLCSPLARSPFDQPDDHGAEMRLENSVACDSMFMNTQS